VAPIFFADAFDKAVLGIENKEVYVLVKREIGAQFFSRKSGRFAVHAVGKGFSVTLDPVSPAWIRVIELVGCHFEIAESDRSPRFETMEVDTRMELGDLDRKKGPSKERRNNRREFGLNRVKVNFVSGHVER
jgi:hypothetical protein